MAPAQAAFGVGLEQYPARLMNNLSPLMRKESAANPRICQGLDGMARPTTRHQATIAPRPMNGSGTGIDLAPHSKRDLPSRETQGSNPTPSASQSRDFAFLPLVLR